MPNKSFFEYLGSAGLEKIHSQILAWLFSEDCNALNNEQKMSLLKKIFNIDIDSPIQNTRTEYEQIDILIETENAIIVIENKIKSSQHSNQLKRYEEFCEQNFQNKKKYYCYLSLVEECIYSEKWLKVSYAQIYDEIKHLQIDNSRNHGVILNEYMIFLNRLTSVLTDFNANYKNYKMVFTDGGKTKEAKRKMTYEHDNEAFIAKNQLETILQKSFLYRLTHEIKPLPLIRETRGDALVNFYIECNIQLGERAGFETYLQIQGNIIKFVFAINGYELDKSNKEWVEDVIPKMEELSKNNDLGYNKLNKPKSKAYISISKKMAKPYWEEEMEDLKTYIDTEIKNGTKLTNELLKALNIKL